ncbi:DUF3836 domain-containing protein [Bacteroides sp.]
MKKSFMSISMLIVSISMVALFLCSSAVNAQTSSKFVYDKNENSETVYTLDKSGKYLTPKLKYEYSKDAQEKKGMKKAYRWNANEQKWVPYYLISMLEMGNNSIVEFAAWDNKTQSFSLNSQKAVYSKGFENDILSCVFYKWNQLEKSWEIDQYLLCGDYLALEAGGVN